MPRWTAVALDLADAIRPSTAQAVCEGVLARA